MKENRGTMSILSAIKALYCFIDSEEISSFKDFAAYLIQI